MPKIIEKDELIVRKVQKDIEGPSEWKYST